VEEIFQRHQVDTVVHFAAESHVDRSILGPENFIQTNIVGTFTLLQAAKKIWSDRNTDKLFHHVSTDEVFGSLGEKGYFCEDTPYDPRSPYSASKASADHLVRAYHHTYNLPATISNCSNNYGPYQFPEKLIPLVILNALDGKKLPVYGEGKNIRDWLFVQDHCAAIWKIIERGLPGETYAVGGENQKQNIEIVNMICDLLTRLSPHPEKDRYHRLITFIRDRPGHDWRYAIDCKKLKSQLDWEISTPLSTGLEKTIRWYLDNNSWVERVRSGEYMKWIDKNY
jgi:dTDP-glucose 4,6-dehydratase